MYSPTAHTSQVLRHNEQEVRDCKFISNDVSQITSYIYITAIICTFPTEVPLGVLAKCKQKGEDMVDIMEFIKQYIPRVSDGSFLPLLFGGDQVTRERASHAQDTKLQSAHPMKRLLGLIPKVEDWHARVVFNQVCE